MQGVIYVTFLAAIIANTLYYLILLLIINHIIPSSLGSSGLVYSTYGFLLAAYLVLLLTHFREKQFKKFIISLIIFATLLGILVVYPKEFLNINKGVNFFVHATALLSSYVLGSILLRDAFNH